MSVIYNRARQAMIDNWAAACDRLGAFPSDDVLALALSVAPSPDGPEAQFVEGLRYGLMLGEMLTRDGIKRDGDLDNTIAIFGLHGFDIDDDRVFAVLGVDRAA